MCVFVWCMCGVCVCVWCMCVSGVCVIMFPCHRGKHLHYTPLQCIIVDKCCNEHGLSWDMVYYYDSKLDMVYAVPIEFQQITMKIYNEVAFISI